MRIIIATLLLGMSVFAAPGDLDTTFHFDGKNILQLYVFEEGEAMALQNDGKIVVAGWTGNQTATNIDAFAARFNTDGSLDTGFGTNGVTIVDFSGVRNWGYAVAIQGDGKIIIAGSVETTTSNYDIGLIRLTSDGNLDTSFGSNGKILADPYGSSDGAVDMVLDLNEKIVVTGSWLGKMGVARFNSDGTYDNSFDGDGRKQISFPQSNSDNAYALTTDSSGNIFIAGNNQVISDADFAVVKLTNNGTLDTSFSGDGLATFSLLTGGTDSARAIALDSNGNIVLAGYVFNSNIDWGITKIDPTGSQIQSFGLNGSVVKNFGTVDGAEAVAIQSDDKILVGGFGNNHMQVGRYNSDGTIDNSFIGNSQSLWGSNGFATADFYLPTNLSDSANALGIDSTGRVVAVGYGSNGGNPDVGIARFLNLAPSAASASISGRVVSSEKGRGVSNAVVYLTDQNGNIKTARANQFGYFRFEEIEVGQTLLINAFHKQYQFNPQVINFNNSITGLNVTAQ